MPRKSESVSTSVQHVEVWNFDGSRILSMSNDVKVGFEEFSRFRSEVNGMYGNVFMHNNCLMVSVTDKIVEDVKSRLIRIFKGFNCVEYDEKSLIVNGLKQVVKTQ
jgi:hypothetical protein